MAAAKKKVLVRTHAQEILPGYLAEAGFLSSAGDAFELLDPAGRTQAVVLATVRWIAYVRDFNLADRSNPENLVRRTFVPRPRSPGLWLRLKLTAGDTLEGLAPTGLGLLDDFAADRGLSVIPPDIRLNTQRLYVPRSGLAAVELLAIITQQPRKPAAKSKGEPAGQADLFPAPR